MSDELKVSFKDKVKHLIGLFENKKLKQSIKLGKKRIQDYFDLLQLIKRMDHHET